MVRMIFGGIRGKHSGNVWYADVKAKEHSYESGTYHIECYAYDSRGVSQNMGSVTKKIKVTKKDRVYLKPISILPNQIFDHFIRRRL